MYRRPLVPDGFAIPVLQTAEFRLSPLGVDDLIPDYAAVMESVGHLKGLMEPHDAWPDGMTLAENLVDLGWHQREFTLRHSFAWKATGPEGAYLGCCYLYPAEDPAFAADAFWWVRQSLLATGLEDRLGAAYLGWLKDCWPLGEIACPGRTHPFTGRYLTR